jgi:hypothetical protein
VGVDRGRRGTDQERWQRQRLNRPLVTSIPSSHRIVEVGVKFFFSCDGESLVTCRGAVVAQHGRDARHRAQAFYVGKSTHFRPDRAVRSPWYRAARLGIAAKPVVEAVTDRQGLVRLVGHRVSDQILLVTHKAAPITAQRAGIAVVLQPITTAMLASAHIHIIIL